ncbi:MAG TPA: hypothetical protein VF203_13645 [Burkholderiales bacterium]
MRRIMPSFLPLAAAAVAWLLPTHNAATPPHDARVIGRDGGLRQDARHDGAAQRPAWRTRAVRRRTGVARPADSFVAGRPAH